MNYSDKTLPGGSLKGKPVQGLDGKWYDLFGKEIPLNPTDVEYSNRFWSRGQPSGLREVMIEAVERAGKLGSIGSFVNPGGIDETNREKLSAYRVLAQQMGYEIGQFSFEKQTGIAKASIRKSSYLS